jgi:hypothetical protein
MISDNGWVHAISGILLIFLGFFRKLKFTINKIFTQYIPYIARKEDSQGIYLDLQAEQKTTNKKLNILMVLAIFLVIGFVIIILRSKKD